MSTETPVIPAETARHVLWHYGQQGGWQPGSFTQNLMRTIDSADMDHAAMLANVFPSLVAAMLAAKLDPDGVANLQRIAGPPAEIRCADCGSPDGPFGERVEGYVCEGCIRKRAS